MITNNNATTEKALQLDNNVHEDFSGCAAKARRWILIIGGRFRPPFSEKENTSGMAFVA